MTHAPAIHFDQPRPPRRLDKPCAVCAGPLGPEPVLVRVNGASEWICEERCYPKVQEAVAVSGHRRVNMFLGLRSFA